MYIKNGVELPRHQHSVTSTRRYTCRFRRKYHTASARASGQARPLHKGNAGKEMKNGGLFSSALCAVLLRREGSD